MRDFGDRGAGWTLVWFFLRLLLPPLLCSDTRLEVPQPSGNHDGQNLGWRVALLTAEGFWVTDAVLDLPCLTWTIRLWCSRYMRIINSEEATALRILSHAAQRSPARCRNRDVDASGGRDKSICLLRKVQSPPSDPCKYGILHKAVNGKRMGWRIHRNWLPFWGKKKQHRDIYQIPGDRMQGDLASWLDQDRPLLLL